MDIVYVHHGWERLRGFGGGWEEREKGGTEKGGMGEVAWLRGEEKDGTEECYHGDGRTNKQVNIEQLSQWTL